MMISLFTHRSTLVLLAALSLSTLHVGASPPGSGIPWASSYESALEQAKKNSGVVFVAVDFADEARSEHFMKKLARDKDVGELATRTWNVVAAIDDHKKSGNCPRFKGMSCSDHRRVEAALRDGVLQLNDLGAVAQPQYVWLNGEGEVLLSVPFEIDKAGLLWCFGTALRLANAETAAPLHEDARVPRRLLMGETYRLAAGDRHGRGMTPKEMQALFKQTRASIFGMGDRAGQRRILFTDEPDAVSYARVELGGAVRLFSSDRLPTLIHSMGVASPASFWKAMEDFQKIDRPEVRMEFAVAMEQMAASKALKVVKAALTKEKDEAVERAWVRAMAACGAEDNGVRKKLLGLVEEDDEELLGASAMIGLGYLAPHEDVRTALVDSLKSMRDSWRVSAACAMAMTRDPAYIESLSSAHGLCGEGNEKEALARCLEVLRGANLAIIEEDVKDATRDFTARERIFFRSN